MRSARSKEDKNRRLASFGAMLEYYDFVAYVYVAAAISQAFFPSEGSETLRLAQTFAIYSIGFVVRPIAGIFMSRVGDRLGRKPTFLFTLALMSAATFGIGVLPTYEQVGWLAPALLLLIRVLQGCAVGGELPAAAVFVSEFAGRDRVGFSGAYLQSMAYGGFLLGAGAALLSGFISDHVFTSVPSLTWRLPFLIGGVLGFVAVYLRRRLEETPAFQEMEKSSDDHHGHRQESMSAILRNFTPAVVFGFFIVGMQSAINVVFFQYWPTYLQVNLGHSANISLAASLAAIVTAMAAMPWWGKVADRYGWPRLFVVGGAVAAITSIGVFAVLPILEKNSAVVIFLSIPVGLAASSLVAVAPGLLSSLFPTEIRQSGYAIPYNVGVAVFAGLLPLSIAPQIASFGVRAPLVIVLAGCLVAFAAAVLVTRIPLYLGRSGTADATVAVNRID